MKPTTWQTWYWLKQKNVSKWIPTHPPLLQHIVMDAGQQLYRYDRIEPMIFIGGMLRSGTTLARVLLDAHPNIRCGEETRVLPRLLQMHSQWVKWKIWKPPKTTAIKISDYNLQNLNTNKHSIFFHDAQVLNSAIAAFIVEIVAKDGEPAKRLCKKDSFTMKPAVYLSELFPQAKFDLMVRDGRATVQSIITRKVTITGFDLSSYRDCPTKRSSDDHVQWMQKRRSSTLSYGSLWTVGSTPEGLAR